MRAGAPIKSRHYPYRSPGILRSIPARFLEYTDLLNSTDTEVSINGKRRNSPEEDESGQPVGIARGGEGAGS